METITNAQDIAALWFSAFFLACILIGITSKAREIRNDKRK